MAGKAKSKAKENKEGIMENKDLIKDEPVETNQPKRLSRKKKAVEKTMDIDRERVVPVVNVNYFTVGYTDKNTGKLIKWNNYGDENMMKIGEVIEMYRDNEKFLKSWLVVDDEEFAKAFELNELYDLIFDLEDLEEFYKQSTQKIKEQLDSLSESMRKDILNRTVAMIYNGEINNLSVVSFLKREYKIEVEI